MNFLAHLYLAGDSPELIVGNMLGDFVEHDFHQRYDSGIVSGILMHKAIDKFTDSHPVFVRSKKRINDEYRHLKGIMVDLFYDHFLAKNWPDYSDEPLEMFTIHVYEILDSYKSIMPPRLQRMLPYMAAENWLLSYRQPEGIALALGGISRRISRANKLGEGIQELYSHYPGLEKDFAEFFPEIIKFIKLRDY